MTDKDLGAAAGDIFAKAFTLGYETGRNYIPASGMALTAEQVEDVRTVLEYAGGMPHESRIRLRRAALRLVDAVGYPNAYLVQELREALAEVDALFPAADPAEEPREIGWFRTMTRKFATEHFGFPEVTGLLECTHRASDGGTWGWGGDGDWELLVYPPAPAEPAEGETKADPFEALHDVISFSSMDFGSASDVAWMYGIVVGGDNDDPDEGEHPHAAMWSIAQRFNWPHRKVRELRNLRAEWVRRTSSPVVPAPTETEDRPDYLGMVTDALEKTDQFQRPWVVSTTYPAKGPSQEVATEAETENFVKLWMAAGYNVTVTAPLEDSPTETGPWQTWEEVPDGVKYRSHRWPSGAVWFNRDSNRYVHTPDSASYISGIDDDDMNTNIAPFVAAKEG